MAAPLFSIVFACRNAALTLAGALDSAHEQTCTDREIVVVDAASSDGTVALLAARQSPDLVVVSEPDRGVYDAMNKGIQLARGDWLLFLGADDRLASPDVLTRTSESIAACKEGLLFAGEAAYADGRIWPAPAQPNVRYRNFIHHQATFYHRSLFERFRYDETLRIQADYDLNLRLWCAGIRPRPLPVRVAVCSPGGLSDSGRWDNYREEITIRHRHFPAWQCWPWDAAAVARYFRKKILRNHAITRPE